MEEQQKSEGINRYSLSTDDFKIPPEKVQDYEFPQRVSRDNFTDWLVSSFEVSRGDVRAQVEWMRYAGNRTGFDPQSSLESFLHAGGLKVLVGDERAEFEAKFNRVILHSEERIHIDEDFVEALDAVMSKFNDEIVVVPNAQSLGPKDFLRALRQRVTERKDRLEHID